MCYLPRRVERGERLLNKNGGKRPNVVMVGEGLIVREGKERRGSEGGKKEMNKFDDG